MLEIMHETSAKDLCASLEITPQQLSYWARKGYVSVEREGRHTWFDRDEVERFLSDCAIITDLKAAGLLICTSCGNLFDVRERSCERLDRKCEECFREYMRAIHLARTYDITPAEYDKIYKKQKGRCAICGKRQGKREMPVDHCHRNNHVRGLLCHACNMRLGHLEDIDWLEKALDYLGSTTTDCRIK